MDYVGAKVELLQADGSKVIGHNQMLYCHSPKTCEK
jgi:hypothetical protein